MELTDIERETILSYAECDMNANKACRAAFVTRNGFQYRLKIIREKTGLNPKCFYDLIELVDMCCQFSGRTPGL